MKKFVAVMNVPAPYRQHLFNELWRQLQERGVDFHVHYMARGFGSARPDSWTNPQINFPHTYWKNYGTSEHQFNPGMIAHLLAHQPEWLLCGSSFYTPTGIAVMTGCTVPMRIAWVEGNTKTPGALKGLKGMIKRWVLSKCKYAAVPGSDAARYIGLHQTLTLKKMPTPVLLPNLVDETRFRARNTYAVEELEAIRKRINVVTPDRICLIPARLTEVKGLVPFIKLLDNRMLAGWQIVILGRGELKANIFAAAREQGVADQVKIYDYVAYEEMPLFYAVADMLLMPSLYDPNPLTVIEALHSSLPVAVTCQAGNVEEAVTEGRNGWVLPVKDREAFASKLREVFATPVERLREMGRLSRAENAKFWETKGAIRRFLDEVGVAGKW